MIRGLYTAASGLLAQQIQNDLSANNLANVNSAGYKKDVATFRSFPEQLIIHLNDQDLTQSPNRSVSPGIGQLGTGVALDRIYTSFEPGSLRATENPLDLALDGDGYFVIQTAQGERFTRGGAFRLDNSQQLVTMNGDAVMGDRGPIVVDGDSFSINEDGQVIVDGTIIDNLRLVKPADPNQLIKEGNNLFNLNQMEQDVETAAVKVRSGFLENANVNPIEEMINLITVMRAYEANQKTIQAHDNLLDKAVNEVGKV